MLTDSAKVHYVLPNGKHRPALVVENWNDKYDGKMNLLVFLDGLNDALFLMPGEKDQLVVWRPSTPYSEQPTPCTWHWIESHT